MSKRTRKEVNGDDEHDRQRGAIRIIDLSSFGGIVTSYFQRPGFTHQPEQMTVAPSFFIWVMRTARLALPRRMLISSLTARQIRTCRPLPRIIPDHFSCACV